MQFTYTEVIPGIMLTQAANWFSTRPLKHVLGYMSQIIIRLMSERYSGRHWAELVYVNGRHVLLVLRSFLALIVEFFLYIMVQPSQNNFWSMQRLCHLGSTLFNIFNNEDEKRKSSIVLLGGNCVCRAYKYTVSELKFPYCGKG